MMREDFIAILTSPEAINKINEFNSHSNSNSDEVLKNFHED
jgi:hypothetical protein